MGLRAVRVEENAAGAYREFVSGCRRALAQQTWEWGRVVAGVGCDVPSFFTAVDEDGRTVGALPAFRFEAEYGDLLISVPQAGGYGGVVEDLPDRREEIYKILVDAFLEEAATRGCCLATIATAPFFGDLSLYREHFRPDFEKENFYQFIDLRGDVLAGIPSKQRGNILRNLHKARAAGLRVSFADTDDAFGAWYAIHRRRMEDVGACPLPEALFAGARRDVLGCGKGFFAYAHDARGTVVGGGFFLGQHDVLDVFMLCSTTEEMGLQPNTLVLREAIDRAVAEGFRFLNWQSSSSRESSVYAYKKSWGAVEGIHHYLTRVTGDIGRLRTAPLSRVREMYRFHYVMPYDRFKEGAEA